MKDWLRAHRILSAGVAVLVLGGVAVLVFALLRATPGPPVATPSASVTATTTADSSPATTTTPVTTTTTRTTTAAPPGLPVPESLRGKDVTTIPTARTIAAVNAQGDVAVRWTVDTLGWQGTTGGGSAARVVDRTIEALQPGEIVLMHIGSHPEDHSTLDADALRDVISAVRTRGYDFVTLDTLLGAGST